MSSGETGKYYFIETSRTTEMNIICRLQYDGGTININMPAGRTFAEAGNSIINIHTPIRNLTWIVNGTEISGTNAQYRISDYFNRVYTFYDQSAIPVN